MEGALARRYGTSPPSRLRRIVARDHLRAVLIGYPSRLEDARQEFARAQTWLPTILESGSLIEDTVAGYLRLKPVGEALRMAEGVFDDLLPANPQIRKAKDRIVSRLHMRAVFKSNERGEQPSVGKHLWPGIRRDPAWLLNRGVWAIGMRGLLHRLSGRTGDRCS